MVRLRISEIKVYSLIVFMRTTENDVMRWLTESCIFLDIAVLSDRRIHFYTNVFIFIDNIELLLKGIIAES